MAKTVVWKCPKCKVEVKITNKKKEIVFNLSPKSYEIGFPSHADCELAKPISRMDFDKLIKVRQE